LTDSGAFISGAERLFTWKEGWNIGKKDTTLLPRNLSVTSQGDTVLHGDTLLRVHFAATDGYPLPGSVVTHLGFNPSKLLFDSVAIPDPGPALGFPVLPEIGWRDTLTSGNFHFVRELTGLDTISWHGSRVENWAFSDTLYWNGTAVSTAVYSMSRYGLLQLYVQRAGFNAHGDTTAGLLWLQVTAQ
jgi:hypothetical protein